MTWFETKMFLEHTISIDPDAMHVITRAVLFLVLRPVVPLLYLQLARVGRAPLPQLLQRVRRTSGLSAGPIRRGNTARG